MNSLDSLTARQTQILDFIRDRLNDGRSLPTTREISAALGLKSPATAHAHLKALIKKGFLQQPEGPGRSLRLPRQLIEEKRLPGIPLLGSIPAGRADLRSERVEKTLHIDLSELHIPRGSRVFALRVSGDSMTGRLIADGDIVILEQGPEPRHNDVVAALIDGESTLKTFVRKGKSVFLRAENPRYPDLIPAAELMIQGVMRMLIRQTPASP